MRDLVYAVSNERTLSGVGTKFGKNSAEYEAAGGGRKSERKKCRKKRSVSLRMRIGSKGEVFGYNCLTLLTTLEYEDGAVADLGRVFESIAPHDAEYEHHLRWGDDNGHSHVRAALLGPSLSVPFVGGRLTLGTWQQIILIDFDTRPRAREVVAQIVEE